MTAQEALEDLKIMFPDTRVAVTHGISSNEEIPYSFFVHACGECALSFRSFDEALDRLAVMVSLAGEEHGDAA